MDEVRSEGLLAEEIERRIRMEKQLAIYEEYLAKKRDVRLRVAGFVAAFFLVASGGLAYYYLNGLDGSLSLGRIAALVAPVLIAVVFAMVSYLMPSQKFRYSSGAGGSYAQLKYYIDKRLSDAVQSLGDRRRPDIEFSESDKAKVVAGIQAKLESDALQSYVSGIQELVSSRVKESVLERSFERVVGRLGQEVQDLGRRGNLNLILGIFTTLVGISFLCYAVFAMPVSHSHQELFAYFLPRVSLVVLVEVFAYFFLRLYKQSLSEIKYFQNEMTNIESKQLALNVAIMNESTDLIGRVVDELSKTERNFILGKDQTTVDIERERLAKGAYADSLSAIKDIFKQKA